MLEVYAIVVTAALVGLLTFLGGYMLATRRAAASVAALLFPSRGEDAKPDVQTKPMDPKRGGGYPAGPAKGQYL